MTSITTLGYIVLAAAVVGVLILLRQRVRKDAAQKQADAAKGDDPQDLGGGPRPTR